MKFALFLMPVIFLWEKLHLYLNFNLGYEILLKFEIKNHLTLAFYTRYMIKTESTNAESN